jgi:monoterpene epsilon-lactone hydrolase
MSQEQRDAVDQMMREGPLDLGGELMEQRVILEQMLTSQPLADDVSMTRQTLGATPVVAIDISGTDSDDVILYFHGGAYALGTAASAAGLASELGRRAGAQVISVDYRLAPEHPHPAAVEDAVDAYRALIGAGQPASRIAIAGESAGAGLGAATLVALKSAGLPQPSCAALISPWADLTLTGQSMKTKAGVDPALTPEGMRRRAADYLNGGDASAGLVSPVFADLTGLPPLLIQAGSHEILLDDAVRLAAGAAAADVAVTLDVTPGVPHVFQAFAAILDEGEAALARAGAFLRSNLTRTTSG